MLTWNELNILSYGAGTPSTTLALISCQNAQRGPPYPYPLVPVYDAVIFCDLHSEPGCGSCPLRQKCLNETDKAGARKLQDSYFKSVVQQHFSRRWEPKYREALKLRQIWCEGTFAAQKWGHNLTRLLRRGLEAAEDLCLLSAAALNLKRMIRCLN